MSTRTVLRNAQEQRSSWSQLNAIRIIATIIGVIFGLSGMNHGFFEILQGNKSTDGLIIQAIGPEQRFWAEGTEEALTIIPNFMVSGILSIIIGLLIVIWSLRYLHRENGRTIFLVLFILLFLVGGGIGQIAFFIPAWAFATRMDKPLNWWKKVLPQRSWPGLSMLWPITLTLSTICILYGIGVAIFGYVPGMSDPAKVQNVAMGFVMASAVLNILTFIAGIGHDLQRKYVSYTSPEGSYA